jgi:hypothetical protein
VGQVETPTAKLVPARFACGTRFDWDLEPERIRELHEVRARRVEPVGLDYLRPETN